MTRQRLIYSKLVAFGVMLILVAAPNGLLADITWTGNVNPQYTGAGPWAPSATDEILRLDIGYTSAGTYSVTNGSQINSAIPLAIGVWVGAGSTTGAPRGQLDISGGGQVTAPSASIGGYPFELISGTFDPLHISEGVGRVNVTGASSKLTVGAEDSQLPLFVGYTGQGQLYVYDNAQVTADSVAVGAGPMGNGHIIVNGASFAASYDLLVGAWANQAGDDSANVLVENGGHVTTGKLEIGGFNSEPGTDSGISQSMHNALGYTGGRGVVTVKGNSTLDVSGQAYIGYSGTAKLDVKSGGAVTAYQTTVGLGPGSTGTLTVDGATVAGEGTGATYHVVRNTAYEENPGNDEDGAHPKSGALIVGAYGTGTTTVKNGGQLIADRAVYVGGFMLGELPFTGSIEGESIEGAPDGTGHLTIEGSTSSLTTPVIAVGATGTGYLDLRDNASLTTQEAGIGVAAGSHGEAVVSNTPGSWDNSGSMFVGGYGTGSLTVQPGGHVDIGKVLYIGGYDPEDITSAELYNGDAPNGTGTVTVTGAGTALGTPQLEAMGIGVGIKGTGTLQIQNGGRVDSQIGVVGASASGTGTVTVDGAHSLWSLSGTTPWPEGFDPLTEDMAKGAGTVTVSNGGTIQIGANDEGGSNAALIVADKFTVGSTGLNNTVSVAHGGLVQSGELVIGGTNPGYDTIQEYMDPEADLGTGTGTVNITGAQSQWQTGEEDVFVGFSGTGTLNVTDGQVTSRAGWLGMMPDATGAATFTGDTAAWTNQGTLTVGGWGQGTLNIENGAHVSASEAFIGGMPLEFVEESFDPDLSAHGTGIVNVTGAGSTLNVLGADTLYVGYSGTGTLNVLNHGQVNTDSAVIGAGPDVVGTVTVDGDGSQMSVANDAIVGVWGEGHLMISDQGQVEAQGLYIGGLTASQVANVDPDHAIRNALGDPEGTGFVTVTGTGSSLTVTGEETLVVGTGGTGTLTIANHGQVTSPDSFVGGYLRFNEEEGSETRTAVFYGGTGTAQVTGPGSQWHTNALVVGVGGTGTLEVSNGGQVDSHLGGVGFAPDSSGIVTVTGPDSSWITAPGNDPDTDAGNGELMVGGWGQGQLTVANAGRVDAQTLYIGGFDLDVVSDPDTNWGLGTPAGTGTVTVTGTDSQLNVTGTDSLYIGYSGTGTLTVNQGGQVTSDNGFLAYLAGSNGTATVTGADSTWNVGGNLYVGGTSEAAGGTGSLLVSDGGLVDVAGEMIVWQTGTLRGNGTVTVQDVTTLHNYGTIAPGSSSAIGTLTVNGNVVFESGSTYAVKIDQTSSDKLAVNGDATINGGTVRISPVGTVVGAHDYEVLTANSVGGTFDVLDTALLSVSDASLSYLPDGTPDSVWLHIVAANFDDPTIARTPNQRQLGRGLQEIADGGGNDVTDALQQVETPENLRHNYDQLSGQTRSPLAPLAATGTSRFLGTVNGRVQSLQTGLASGMSDTSLFAMSGPDSRTGDGRMNESAAGGQSVAVGNGSNILADSKWGLWGRGYGLFGDRETEWEAPGYTYHLYGGGLGLDYQFTEKFLGGVVFGMTNGDVDFAGMRDTADLQAIHVGLYGNLTCGKWYASSMASYGHVQYDTERFVDLTSERLTGDLNGNDWSAYVEAGQNLSVGPKTVMQPLASLQYSYLGLGSYTETGGASALSYDDQDYQSVKGSLGARLTRQLFESISGCRGDGQLRARWVHEFGDSQSSVDTAFASTPAVVFTIRDAEIARDSAVVGAGLGANITKQLRVSADYDTLLNTDETVQMVSAALQYRW